MSTITETTKSTPPFERVIEEIKDQWGDKQIINYHVHSESCINSNIDRKIVTFQVYGSINLIQIQGIEILLHQITEGYKFEIIRIWPEGIVKIQYWKVNKNGEQIP